MKDNRNTRFLPVIFGLASAVFALALFTGCASESPNTPPEQLTFAPGETPFVHTGVEPGAGLSGGGGWTLVASKFVEEGEREDVQGSRYELEFDRNSLYDDATIEIWERNPNVIDVQFGPHGINFDEPVELEVDYSGTNCDPDSPNYDGSVPKFFYFDESVQLWVEIPSEIDAADKEVDVELEHFSRYALFGTPGW